MVAPCGNASLTGSLAYEYQICPLRQPDCPISAIHTICRHWGDLQAQAAPGIGSLQQEATASSSSQEQRQEADPPQLPDGRKVQPVEAQVSASLALLDCAVTVTPAVPHAWPDLVRACVGRHFNQCQSVARLDACMHADPSAIKAKAAHLYPEAERRAC